MSEQQNIGETGPIGTSPVDQEAAEAQKQSELQAQRDEHNRRVAPGGAELPDPVTGHNPDGSTGSFEVEETAPEVEAPVEVEQADTPSEVEVPQPEVVEPDHNS